MFSEAADSYGRAEGSKSENFLHDHLVSQNNDFARLNIQLHEWGVSYANTPQRWWGSRALTPALDQTTLLELI